jgi:uncharacterized protein YciI
VGTFQPRIPVNGTTARGPASGAAAFSLKPAFVVIETRGPAWHHGRPMDEQADFAAHAAFVDSLGAGGFIILGGPLEGTSDVILVVRADARDEISRRLAADPWLRDGVLTLKHCRPWRIRLGTLA